MLDIQPPMALPKLFLLLDLLLDLGSEGKGMGLQSQKKQICLTYFIQVKNNCNFK